MRHTSTKVAKAQGAAEPDPSAGSDRVTVALLAFATVALVSLFGARSQVEAVDEAALWTGVTAVVAVFALAARPYLAAPKSRLAVAWTAFLASSLVSALFSGRIWTALMGEATSGFGWFALASATLIAVAASTRAASSRRALEVAAPVVITAQLVVTAVQLSTNHAARGTLPNSTYLGELLLVLLPFVVVGDKHPLGLSRTAQYALAGATVLLMAAAGARVATAVGLVWVAWLLLRRFTLSKWAKAGVIGGLAMLAVGAAFLFRPLEMGQSLVGMLGGRHTMWTVALRALATKPLLGFGPDGFVAGGTRVMTTAFAREAELFIFRPGMTDPHSLPVWIAVSAGLIGLAFFTWAVVELILVWYARVKADSGSAAAAIWGSAGALIVFLTAPVSIHVLSMFAFVLGTSLAASPKAAEEPQPARGLRPLGRIILVVACLAALLFAGDAATRRALERYGERTSARSARIASIASNVWRLDADIAHLAALHLGWAARSDQSVAAAQLDLRAIERACEVDVYNPFVALERARTLRFYSWPQQDVVSGYEAVFDRWPVYPEARIEYADFLVEQGRLDEAQTQLETAALLEHADGYPGPGYGEVAAALDAARGEQPSANP